MPSTKLLSPHWAPDSVPRCVLSFMFPTVGPMLQSWCLKWPHRCHNCLLSTPTPSVPHYTVGIPRLPLWVPNLLCSISNYSIKT